MAATISEAPAASTSSHEALSASYRSPQNADFTHRIKIPIPSGGDSADKPTYIGVLRAAVVTMQDLVNAELTARMDEDKALEASSKSGREKPKGVDEAKEEDNYGEEVPEED